MCNKKNKIIFEFVGVWGSGKSTLKKNIIYLLKKKKNICDQRYRCKLLQQKNQTFLYYQFVY